MHHRKLMATQRIPPDPRPSLAEAPPKEASPGDRRHLKRLAAAISGAQIIIALAVVLVICYVGKLVFVTVMVSILLAFVLEPIVDGLERIRVPRALGAFIAILVLLGATYGISYFFYNRAVGFAQELPKYSQKIRSVLAHVIRQKNELQQVGEKVLPQEQQKKNAVPVTVVNNNQGSIITNNLGTVTEIALTVIFIPFLVYFMLSWQEHARTHTVQLFPDESRTTVYVTMGQISQMMRSFIAGNFMIGVFMGIGGLVVFGLLGLPYFYFLGFISGFVSLIPYLGVILAVIPPITAGIGHLSLTGMVIVILTVAALHLFSMNVLYPKIIGKRLQLNPLVVTIGLLIWGFIWGAMGLVLAVPLLGALKIICDHVPQLHAIGAWMGE